VSTATYTPPSTTLANMCGWLCQYGQSSVLPYNNGSLTGFWVDELDGPDWDACCVRLTGGAFSGTVSNATLTIPRFNDNNGSNGTLRIRCEASNNPSTWSTASGTANPSGRTYRTAYVDVTFAANGTAVNVDVTTLIQDLLAAGFTYTGTEAIIFVIGSASCGAGWGSAAAVSWRSLWTTSAPPSLSITFSAGGGGVTVTAGAGSGTGAGSDAGTLESRLVGAAADAGTGAGSDASITVSIGIRVGADAVFAYGEATAASILAARSIAANAAEATGQAGSVNALSSKSIFADYGSGAGLQSLASIARSFVVLATPAYATGIGMAAQVIPSHIPALGPWFVSVIVREYGSVVCAVKFYGQVDGAGVQPYLNEGRIL
jgi:hypothetical protein